MTNRPSDHPTIRLSDQPTTMLTNLKSHATNITTLIAIIVLAAILLWLAPVERTLGTGIKFVYLHVAFIWTGMTGLSLLGILGAVWLIWNHKRLQAWTQALGWVSIGFFVAGMGMSVAAAKVNWGAMFWQEPRTVAMMQVLAVALIIQIVTSWPLRERFTRYKGWLHLGVAAYLAAAVFMTDLVLHPKNPIQTSPSPAIQLSFLGLFLLCCLAAAWIVVYSINKEVI